MKSLKFIAFFIIIFHFFYSCKGINDSESRISEKQVLTKSVKDENIQKIIQKDTLNLSTDFNACEKVKEFLNYYEHNYLIIYKDEIVDYKNQEINFNLVKLMFKRLNIQNYFTNSFENEYLKHIRKVNVEIKSMNEKLIEIPSGLQYDYFLLSQEIDELLSYIASNNYKCSLENNNCVHVNFKGVHNLYFYIINNKIDKIKLENICL